MEFGIIIFRLEDGTIQQKVLKAGANALGRDAANDLVLPANAVSRFHARLICTPSGCRIIDRESANGTRVNGERLQPNVERVLNHGDTIEIGPYQMRYLRPRRPTPPPEVVKNLPTQSSVTILPSNLALPAEMRPEPVKRSSYFKFLPPFYATVHGDSLLDSLLCIAESILAPLDRQISQLDCYVDPQIAPEAQLPWLAFWVDQVLNANWPLERRRALIMRAADLYRWRGTRKGLRDYIEAFTEVVPIIVEPKQEVLASNPQLRKEVLHVLGLDDPGQIAGPLRLRIEQPLPDSVFRVIMVARAGVTFDEAQLRQIIEAEKPAHTGYELVLWR